MSESRPERSTPGFFRSETALAGLESHILRGGRPMAFNPESAMFTERTVAPEDAWVRPAEVDVADPVVPDVPLTYNAAVFTDAGTQRSGLLAQLERDATNPDVDEYPLSLVYQFRIDGTVEAFRRDGAGGLYDGFTLQQPEVDELLEQIATLDIPNDQRKLPTILN